MNQRFTYLICFLLLVSGRVWARDLDPGMSFHEYSLPKSSHGDSKLQVITLDPAKYEPHILTVSGGNAPKTQSAREWAKRSGAAVVVNAGMYLKDYRTAVAHLKSKGHVNQPRLSSDKMMLGFGAKKKHSSPALLDRGCDSFSLAQENYQSLLQGIRMYSCKGKNVWTQQKKKWSQVAIALNDKGEILLLFARSPYTTYDFINAVTALPLQIKRMMYLEGGPPAQLYVNTKKLDRGWLGSYSSGANESDDNVLALPFPNALVFKKRN